jgi:hypothetical protein
MFGKRMTLVLVAALAAAACAPTGGGGGHGGASPGAGTQPAPATQAPGGGGGGGASVGVLNLDFGGAKYSYPIVTCVDSAEGLAVIASSDSLQANGAALLMPHDSSTPSISGVVDGKPWVIGTEAKGTLNGKSGSFSGIDMASSAPIKGDFACTN